LRPVLGNSSQRLRRFPQGALPISIDISNKSRGHDNCGGLSNLRESLVASEELMENGSAQVITSG
jgi:hypothetical protein